MNPAANPYTGPYSGGNALSAGPQDVGGINFGLGGSSAAGFSWTTVLLVLGVLAVLAFIAAKVL